MGACPVLSGVPEAWLCPERGQLAVYCKMWCIALALTGGHPLALLLGGPATTDVAVLLSGWRAFQRALDPGAPWARTPPAGADPSRSRTRPGLHKAVCEHCRDQGSCSASGNPTVPVLPAQAWLSGVSLNPRWWPCTALCGPPAHVSLCGAGPPRYPQQYSPGPREDPQVGLGGPLGRLRRGFSGLASVTELPCSPSQSASCGHADAGGVRGSAPAHRCLQELGVGGTAWHRVFVLCPCGQ